MSARREAAWNRQNTYLVTFRHEAAYRLADERLVILAGTQLVGALSEVPEPVLHLGTMSLALSREFADIQPSPDPSLTLVALARQTVQAAHEAIRTGDFIVAAARFRQAAVQQRILGDIDAEMELRASAQHMQNRAARTAEGLADFDRHTAELSDEALRQLGATVRLALRQLGGYQYAPATPAEAQVVWEVIRHAVAQIANLDHWAREHQRPAQPISPQTIWVDGEALVGDLLAEASGPPEYLAALAEVAIALDPDDADGYLMCGRLADAAGNLEEARQWYEAGMRAGERKLGAACFNDPDRPRFWLAVETRPYMRARAALAAVLAKRGDPEQAIAEYWGMLELNPGDNQGIRYLLASLLLERKDLAGFERLYRQIAKPLIEDEEADGAEAADDAIAPSLEADPLDPTQLNVYEGAMWLYPAALYHFQREGDGEQARAALALARSQNPHVIPLLTGRARLPREAPDSYSHGSREEAAIYTREGRAAWDATPGAIAWLRAQAAPQAAPKRAARSRTAPARMGSAADMQLRDLVVAWMDDARTEQTAATKKVYRATIARLIAQLETQGGAATGAALTSVAVADFLATIEPARRGQARNSIRVWCEWLRRQGVLRRNPAAG